MSLSAVLYWLAGSSIIIELEGLHNVLDAATPITHATVTARLLDANGDEVPGITWPVTLSHDADGTYRTTVDGTALSLTVGARYALRVNALVGNLKRQWTPPVRVVDDPD